MQQIKSALVHSVTGGKNFDDIWLIPMTMCIEDIDVPMSAEHFREHCNQNNDAWTTALLSAFPHRKTRNLDQQ